MLTNPRGTHVYKSLELLAARNLIVKCAGGSKMGIQRPAKKAFASLRQSKLFKTASTEEKLILSNTLADELHHRMEWETLVETL